MANASNGIDSMDIGPYTMTRYTSTVLHPYGVHCSVCEIEHVSYFIYYNGTARQYKRTPTNNYVCSEACFVLWVLRCN